MERSYVLVTVAYNEARRLRSLIESVLSQTKPPLRWIIVSDASSDGTDDIIKSYAMRHDFIRYARQEKKAEYSKRLEKVTIAQARAMELARGQLDRLAYDYFGNLDADITLDADYYERVIIKFEEAPSLGIAGGGVFTVNEDGSMTGGGFIKPDFVGGPVQLFRRDCLEDIGGYSLFGHSDSIAIAKAHMMGWKVKCFPEICAYHHELPRVTVREKVPDCFKMGQMDYIMGALLVFEAARCVVRAIKKPIVIAGLSMFSGYVWAFMSGRRKTVPIEIRKHMQNGQIEKLRRGIRSVI